MRKHNIDEAMWAAEAYQFVAGMLDTTRDAHDLESLGLQEREPEPVNACDGDLQNTFEQLAERYMNA